jgi:hypothetical protein
LFLLVKTAAAGNPPVRRVAGTGNICRTAIKALTLAQILVLVRFSLMAAEMALIRAGLVRGHYRWKADNIRATWRRQLAAT